MARCFQLNGCLYAAYRRLPETLQAILRGSNIPFRCAPALSVGIQMRSISNRSKFRPFFFIALRRTPSVSKPKDSYRCIAGAFSETTSSSTLSIDGFARTHESARAINARPTPWPRESRATVLPRDAICSRFGCSFLRTPTLPIKRPWLSAKNNAAWGPVTRL